MNNFVAERLNGLLLSLNATYTSTAASASASKGAGRANFIETFLKQVIPPNLRISTSGEITDSNGNKTGELDIIIENGFFPSLPVSGSDSSRLYFSEGVAAVIEVKSNLKNQWKEVISTGGKILALDRKIEGGIMGGHKGPTVIQIPGNFSNRNFPKIAPPPQDVIRRKVPYFVVGYEGWESPEILTSKLLGSGGVISGILQLNSGRYVCSKAFGGVSSSGSLSLLAFINSIYEASSYMKTATADLLEYGR